MAHLMAYHIHISKDPVVPLSAVKSPHSHWYTTLCASAALRRPLRPFQTIHSVQHPWPLSTLDEVCTLDTMDDGTCPTLCCIRGQLPPKIGKMRDDFFSHDTPLELVRRPPPTIARSSVVPCRADAAPSLFFTTLTMLCVRAIQ